MAAAKYKIFYSETAREDLDRLRENMLLRSLRKLGDSMQAFTEILNAFTSMMLLTGCAWAIFEYYLM